MERAKELRELDKLFHKAERGYPLLTTSKRTMRAWNMIFTIPRLGEFFSLKLESHWHYKLRIFNDWLQTKLWQIRWTVFPYHIIHKNDYCHEDY